METIIEFTSSDHCEDSMQLGVQSGKRKDLGRLRCWRLEAGAGHQRGIWAAGRGELLHQLSVPFHQFIPMPVLYGIFLYMGVAAISSIQVSTLKPINPTPLLFCGFLPTALPDSPLPFSCLSWVQGLCCCALDGEGAREASDLLPCWACIVNSDTLQVIPAFLIPPSSQRGCSYY